MELSFRLNRHLWVGLISVIIGGLAYWEASGWDTQSSSGQTLSNNTFPMLLGAGLVLTGALLLWRARKVEPEASGLRVLGPTSLAMAMIIAYFLLIPYLGFFLMAFLFVFGMLMLLRHTTWWKALLIAAAVVGVVMGVFSYLLKVQFPVGSLFG